MMIKATPFNETKGSMKFKKFLDSPFTVDMLFPVFGDKSRETLFEEWRGKDMLNGLYKFTSDECVLEFHPEYYTIKKNKPSDSIMYRLSIPKTLNDFIDDLNKIDVQLYWTDLIDEKFEPKDYLNINEIKIYWEILLEKMGKSHELL